MTLLGRPGRDPRPPKRYADEVGDYELPRPPSFNEADISDKSSNLTDSAPPLSEATIERLERNYEGRVGSLLAVDDARRPLGARRCAAPASSTTP